MHHVNKMKIENNMIISIDEEKAFDKMQHPFRINLLNNVGVEGCTST